MIEDIYLSISPQELETFSTLIQKFKNLPRLKVPELTYLEIAGYPHYENVCSNILAFFFQENGAHHVQDLFLKSLLQALEVNIDDQDSYRVESVNREEPTSEGKRIDLILSGPNSVIAIENKIFAGLQNDLGAYSTHLTNNYGSCKHVLKVVLSLKKIDCCESKNGFKNLTYNDFFAKLKENMGTYLLNSNPHYSSFLIEFMNTIENLLNKKMIDPELISFFSSSRAAIEKLLSDWESLNLIARSTVLELKQILEGDKRITKIWIYLKNTLVLEFNIQNEFTIVIECSVNVDGINVIAWDRTMQKDIKNLFSKLFLFKQTQEYNFSWDKTFDRCYIIEGLDFLTPLPDLSTLLEGIISKIFIGDNVVIS